MDKQRAVKSNSGLEKFHKTCRCTIISCSHHTNLGELVTNGIWGLCVMASRSDRSTPVARYMPGITSVMGKLEHHGCCRSRPVVSTSSSFQADSSVCSHAASGASLACPRQARSSSAMLLHTDHEQKSRIRMYLLFKHCFAHMLTFVCGTACFGSQYYISCFITLSAVLYGMPF